MVIQTQDISNLMRQNKLMREEEERRRAAEGGFDPLKAIGGAALAALTGGVSIPAMLAGEVALPTVASIVGTGISSGLAGKGSRGIGEAALAGIKGGQKLRKVKDLEEGISNLPNLTETQKFGMQYYPQETIKQLIKPAEPTLEETMGSAAKYGFIPTTMTTKGKISYGQPTRKTQMTEPQAKTRVTSFYNQQELDNPVVDAIDNSIAEGYSYLAIYNELKRRGVLK